MFRRGAGFAGQDDDPRIVLLEQRLRRAERERDEARAELEARDDDAWLAFNEEQAAVAREASARLTRELLAASAARMGVSGPLLDEILATFSGG